VGEIQTGSCQFGYAGNPQRECVEVSGSGEWQEIINPCGHVYCFEEDSPSATWPLSSPGDHVTVSCKLGYFGSPSRNCTQVGEVGVWEQVLDPCQGFSLLLFFSLGIKKKRKKRNAET